MSSRYPAKLGLGSSGGSLPYYYSYYNSPQERAMLPGVFTSAQ